MRRRLTARHGVLAVFALVTLILLGAGALVARSLLTMSLDDAAAQAAGREGRLVANLGLAAALSTGHRGATELRLARAEYAVARKDLPLTGVSVWTPPRRVRFAADTGQADVAAHVLPRVARAALATRTTHVIRTSEPGVGATVEAAVPLGTQALDAVAVFHFSSNGVERDLNAASNRLYIITGSAALVIYLAILPLLARLADRMPLPVDPGRRRALAQLEAALARRQLVLHYQPKTEIATRKVVGVEALVRWNHPQRGLLFPAEFLPIAESNPDLLRALTCQVLHQAIEDCVRWRNDGLVLPVAVNVAAPVLADGVLVRLAHEALERSQLDARMLTIELTESTLMELGADITERLQQLRTLGVNVSIDDFGTGHSSLARLRSLPLDELKVDRSFIAGISTDTRDLGIARHIVELGVELGLQVVAEGVEDEMTLRLVHGLGCSVAQGFYLARPLPEQQLRIWLEGRDTATSALCAP